MIASIVPCNQSNTRECQPYLEEEVTALSVQYGVPCAHTKMCAFETTTAKEANMQAVRKSGKAINLAKYAVGGAAGVLVLGAMAGADFGDVGASMANLGSGIAGAGEALGASLAGLDLDLPDLGCLDDNPLCDAVEPCVGAVGSAIEGIGGVIETIAGCFSGDF
jgi:hypothetical protein